MAVDLEQNTTGNIALVLELASAEREYQLSKRQFFSSLRNLVLIVVLTALTAYVYGFNGLSTLFALLLFLAVPSVSFGKKWAEMEARRKIVGEFSFLISETSKDS